MNDCAIEDREFIMLAVLEGILGAEYVTLEEIYEMEDRVFEEICDEMTPFAIWETIQ